MRTIAMTLILLACDAGKLTIDGEIGPEGAQDGSGDTGSSDDDTGDQPGGDRDGDGFGAGEDCDDSDPTVNPGADELCNGLDDDCNGMVDDDPVDGADYFVDGDLDGFGSSMIVACESTDGFPRSSSLAKLMVRHNGDS